MRFWLSAADWEEIIITNSEWNCDPLKYDGYNRRRIFDTGPGGTVDFRGDEDTMKRSHFIKSGKVI